jgi:hypothetical protein
MWLRRRDTQKVIAVTSQEYATSLMGKPENFLVGRIVRKYLPQQTDVMTEFLQQVAQVVGDVMIGQELHSEAGAICLATSTSISPRWSS